MARKLTWDMPGLYWGRPGATWGGDVADPGKTDDDTKAIRALNAKIVKDSRVEICMTPICDGITMARKI